MTFTHMPFHTVRRNDLVYATDSYGDKVGSWNRVVSVDHEPGHPVCLYLADGTRLVGSASELVSVRRLTLLPGGA